MSNPFLQSHPLHHSEEPLEKAPFERSEIEGSLPARFEKIAAQSAGRLAVKTKRHRWTYEQLNREADRITCIVSHEITQTPAGQPRVQQPIALLFEQGAQSIAALLGVLKSGHIYVPLDPLYPAARNKMILEDLQAPLLLTNSRYFSDAQQWASSEIKMVNVDEARKESTIQENATNPQTTIAPDDLAYILYTSGSSGEPKGVVQTHRNVLFDIWRQSRDLDTSVEDRYGLLFSCSSSASVCHVFGALLNGAAVLPFDLREDGFAHLAEWLTQEEISILDINVATFRHFCSTLTQGKAFPKLRLLSPGSEPVYKRDVELYKKYFAPTCVLQNALGTTETRTVTQFFLDKNTFLDTSLVPVGYEVDEKEVVLLDDMGQEVAPGETGEIAVRSRYLSPGYWRKPEHTAAVFRADPHDVSKRLYLTGDLGQKDADGCLVHLGRKDFQVKIRGYRVEIAEVEQALLKLPGISEAVVAACDDKFGNKRLVAYVVLEDEHVPSVADWRSRLGQTLPDAMIPAQFEFLRALPLTLNGKLDRRALPEPRAIEAAALRSSPGDFVRPDSPDEQKLAALFEEVLDVRPVGATDNFFAMGGDSLLATILAMRIEETFEQIVSSSLLFTAPTVRQLDAIFQERHRVLDSGSAASVNPSAAVCSPLALRDYGEKAPLFCVPGAHGNAMEFYKLTQYLNGDRPVYGFDAAHRDGREHPLRSVEEMAVHYMDEMRVIRPQGPYLLCGYSMGGLVAHEMACRLQRDNQEVALLAFFDTAFYHMPCPRTPRADSALSPTHAMRLRRSSRKRTPVFIDSLNAKAPQRFVKDSIVKLRRVVGRQALRKRAQEAKYWSCVLLRQSIPRAIAETHRTETHTRAAARYVPGVSAGRIDFFRAVHAEMNCEGTTAQSATDSTFWNVIAEQGVEFHDVRGTHHLVGEPFVGDLARQLQQRLNQIRDAAK